MANGMILRGEVYWVSLDDSAGSEIKTGRPAVIISGDRANEMSLCVMVAFITSQGKPHPHNVSVQVNGEPRRVVCDQIRTIAKERLTRYMCTLAKSEMIRVTGALATAMCIPLRTPESTSQEKENKEITALKAEVEMWKRCYDVVMTQLVELKVNSDLALRMDRVGYEYEESEETEDFEESEEVEVVTEEATAVTEEFPVVEAPVVEEPPKVEEPEELVEINTCTAEDLKRCGCNPDMIRRIMDNRPYMRLDELRVVDGVTSVAYGILKHKLCCVPVKVEEPEVVVEAEEPETPPVEIVPALAKVNINTATIKEIANHLNVNQFYAGRITSHRNKNGKFVDLEELKIVEGLPKNFYDKYADLCTISESEEQPKDEPTVEEPKFDGEKININTATAGDLHTKLGLSMTVCYSITGVRKRNGPYKSIEELKTVPRFVDSHYEKYKHMLTVGEPEESEEPEEQEPESDKVNINTASLRELMAVGFEKRAAALIVNERKKYGRFRSVDDLAEIPEISGRILRKLREKLEV